MKTAEVHKNTVQTLMMSTAFGQAGYVAAVALVGLLAAELLGSDSLAGMPSAAATLGSAGLAIPLAVRSRRLGRRPAVVLGYVIGAAGALVAFAAGQFGSFWLLVLAMAAFGSARASNLQSRFAAADLATERTRAGAIALVVWVGTVGAVIGPPSGLWADRVGVAAGFEPWTGPMLLAASMFFIGALIVTVRLRPDPLAVAGGIEPGARATNPFAGTGTTIRQVWTNDRARLAVIAMAVSQMAMVAVMTMTPLHMRDHGHADLSTLVISAHVLGMFGLSPVVGRLADRFGRLEIVISGAAILGTGTISAVIAGYVPGLMFVGLFLLGLGWSFALVAGSALLTESMPVSSRVASQGFADLAMGSLGAVAAFGSGLVKASAGFHWLANFATFSALAIMLAALAVARSNQTEAAPEDAQV